MYQERKDIIMEKKQQFKENIFQRLKEIDDTKRKYHHSRKKNSEKE